MMSLEDEVNASELVRKILAIDFLRQKVEASAHDEEFKEYMVNALEKALKNPDTNDFDTGLGIAAQMLRDGEQLPDWLASFAADVLEGKKKRPTKRGPDKYKNWFRDYTLAWAVFEVSRQYGLPEYTNNELSDKVTASQFVAETAFFSLNVVQHAVRKFRGTISCEKSLQDTEN